MIRRGVGLTFMSTGCSTMAAARLGMQISVSFSRGCIDQCQQAATRICDLGPRTVRAAGIKARQVSGAGVRVKLRM